MFFDKLKINYDKLSSTEQHVIDYLIKEKNLEAITLKTIKQDIYIYLLQRLLEHVRSWVIILIMI